MLEHSLVGGNFLKWVLTLGVRRTRLKATRHRQRTPLGKWTPVRTGVDGPEKSLAWRNFALRTGPGLRAHPPGSPTCSARTRALRAP